MRIIFNNSTNVLGIHLRMTDVNTVSKLRKDSDSNLSKEGKIKLFKDYNREVFKNIKNLSNWHFLKILK